MGRVARRAGRAPHVLIVVENQSVPGDRRVWLEATALVGAGYAVTVISPEGTVDDKEPYELRDGIAIHRFSLRKEESGRPIDFAAGYVSSWAKVARLAFNVYRERPFDLLQTCNPPDTYFLLARLFRPLGVRFLFDQHDLCPEVYATRFGRPSRQVRRTLELLERLTHRAADHVITVNESCRELLLSRTSTPPDRLSVVRTGPDLARLRQLPADEGLKNGRPYLCCYLGVMGPQDGVDLVLRAAQVLVHDHGRTDVYFALLGFGECLPALRQLAQELDIDDRVTFTGRVNSDEISAWFSSSDLGLQPDPKTEFTDLCSMLKTIEYMAFGLPVVAFDLRETRRSAGDAARYVTDETPESYAAAVAALLDDEPARQRMSEVGRERARTVLAWERQAAAYLKVVAQLVGRPPVTEPTHGPLIESSATARP